MSDSPVAAVTRRTVTWEDQLAFAARSGDWNPFHVDAIAARRTAFGRPVVHGMHLVEMAVAATADAPDRRLGHVRGVFRHPVPVGAEIEISARRDAGSSRWNVAVDVDVWRALDLVVEFADRRVPTPARDDRDQRHPPADTPRTVEIAEVEGMAGRIDLNVSSAPEAVLPALSRLVGMHVPGLHSVFSSFDVTFSAGDPTSGNDHLDYVVDTVDERFGRIGIAVSNARTSGRVVAFFRPPPTVQPSPEQWPAMPEPGEFAGQRAMVVGGSRGLGAATAMLLAAGGAEVTLTWRAGRDDADEVAGIIRRAGGAATVLELDVTDAASIDRAVTASADSMPTQLWFFATPPIFDGVNGVYSDALLDRFRAVYVDGFARLFAALDHRCLQVVVNPSSVAVDDTPGSMREYADAKRDAEATARELAAAHPSIHVATPRLPRLATDQTASVMPTDVADTIPVLLALIRSVR
ncbi:MAG: SDR family NAD(P)-dependent oxidoreductase [Ilumatobacteraceae bacterium]